VVVVTGIVVVVAARFGARPKIALRLTPSARATIPKARTSPAVWRRVRFWAAGIRTFYQARTVHRDRANWKHR
jgi:hypothetical protein